MELTNCEYDLNTKFVESCGNCRLTRFQRRIPVAIGRFILYVTYKYEIKNCFQGFTDGDFLYALSLLPKEEQEVEIVQKSRYERELHEQRSVESEFEQEFMNTLRTEVSASHDVNTSASAEAGFNFFDLFGAGASAGVNTASHFASSIFAETVTKTAIKVSNHYEVSVDIKTQIENQYRSLRKISNPNACKVVTYFFKQLNKKFTLSISLVDVKFDLVQQVPVIHSGLLPYHSFEKAFAVAARQPRVLPNENPVETDQVAADKNQLFRLKAQVEIPQVRYLAINRYKQLVYRNVELAKELSAEELEGKISTLQLEKQQKEEITKQVKSLTGKAENKPGFILFKTEYCVRTSSVMAEPKVSRCSICDCNDCECEESKGIRELEMEKLKAEIDLLRKQIDKV
jgi:hypothetical protein